MLEDFSAEHTPTNFYPNNPVKVYEFRVSQDGEITPVTNIPQQPVVEQEAFHLEVLAPEDFSLLTVHETIDLLNAAYNFATFEWNITVAQMIEVDSLIICVVRVG